MKNATSLLLLVLGAPARARAQVQGELRYPDGTLYKGTQYEGDVRMGERTAPAR
jgi:hypothetical protein